METQILLGELREFKRQTVAELKEIRQDVKYLTHSHLTFKFKVIGIAACAAFLATLLVEIARS